MKSVDIDEYDDEELDSLVGNQNGHNDLNNDVKMSDHNRHQKSEAKRNTSWKIIVTFIIIVSCIVLANKHHSVQDDKAAKSNDLSHDLNENKGKNTTMDLHTNTTGDDNKKPTEKKDSVGIDEQQNDDDSKKATESEEKNEDEMTPKAGSDLENKHSIDDHKEIENVQTNIETNLSKTTDVNIDENNNDQKTDDKKPSEEVEITKDPDPTTATNILNDPEKGFRKPEAKLSDTYLLRGKPISEADRTKLQEKWGAWKLKAPPIVESLDIASYPNGDVPREVFPQNAWQTNPEFLKDWLPESIALTERAMEAILAEYGNGPDDIPDKTFDERSYMFSVDILEKRDAGSKPPYK